MYKSALVELARQTKVPEHVVAWLYRVVKHRALNAVRGARRRRERESRSMAERLVAARQSGEFDRNDQLAAIEALETLEIAERELVVMRILSGLKYEEIAAALNISTSSAHRQYERALTKLRHILEPPCSTNANRKNQS